jgi:hypothetical protein
MKRKIFEINLEIFLISSCLFGKFKEACCLFKKIKEKQMASARYFKLRLKILTLEEVPI